MVEIQILKAEEYDDEFAADYAELCNAASAVDTPYMPPRTARSRLLDLRHGWDGDGPTHIVTACDSGRLVGAASLHVSHWEDNQHSVYLPIRVHPDHRRRGHGSALLLAAHELAAGWGKSLLVSETVVDSAGESFAAHHGFTNAQINAQRRLDLTTVDHERIDKLHDDAADKAEGYELIRLEGRAPESMIPDLVDVVAAINDAPLDDLEWEDEVYSEERIRAFEAAQAARERRIYRIFARRISDGAWAGNTAVAVEADLPSYAEQLDTSVVADHRGRRLGMWLKTAMLRWLRDAEPEVEMIDTWNAESNTHMIAVNDELGCFLVARESMWQHHI